MKFYILLALAALAVSSIAVAVFVVKSTRQQIKELSDDLDSMHSLHLENEIETSMIIDDLQGEIRTKSEQISVLEESIDPKNKRWAKIRNLRKVIQEISLKKGRNLTISELTRISSSIIESSEQFDIEVPLILAVMTQESAFEPKSVSHRGAKGLMQLMDATAKECADDLGIRYYDVFNIKDNVRLGTWYIWKMMNRFKLDPDLTVRAYNCGPTCVESVIAGDWESGWPKETAKYVIEVLNYKAQYEKLGL